MSEAGFSQNERLRRCVIQAIRFRSPVMDASLQDSRRRVQMALLPRSLPYCGESCNRRGHSTAYAFFPATRQTAQDRMGGVIGGRQGAGAGHGGHRRHRCPRAPYPFEHLSGRPTGRGVCRPRLPRSRHEPLSVGPALRRPCVLWQREERRGQGAGRRNTTRSALRGADVIERCGDSRSGWRYA